MFNKIKHKFILGKVKKKLNTGYIGIITDVRENETDIKYVKDNKICYKTIKR